MKTVLRFRCSTPAFEKAWRSCDGLAVDGEAVTVPRRAGRIHMPITKEHHADADHRHRHQLTQRAAG